MVRQIYLIEVTKMTEKNPTISAQTRTILKRKVSQLRDEGLTPAVVYGSGIDSTAITVNTKEFIQLYKEAGGSTIIDLVVEGQKEPMKVLVKDVDLDYVKRRVLHVSFYKVNMNVAITTVIPLEFIGESLAEKEGAVLLSNFDEVEVKCLPKDLPDHLEVDQSKLGVIGDTFTFAQLVLPEGVTLAMEEDELNRPIITATAPVTEEEEAAKLAEGSSAIEEVEVTEQGVEVEGEEGSEESTEAGKE